MRVVLYEWCCSGGWQGPDAARMQCGDDRAATALQQSALMAEGWAMLSALARDAVRDPKLAVTVLVGEDALSTMTTAAPLPAGACRICRVSPGAELDILLHEAVRADWTVIVAPETAGLLASRVEAVRMAGGRAAACGGGFIAVAADKQLTANALAAAGVPVPAGRSLAADEPLPAFFRLPAVRKARGSVGCDDLVVVGARGQLLPPTTGPQRLEAFAAGMPVGVSCLCGPAGTTTLPPVRQLFSSGESPRYLGGTVLPATVWGHRAEQLAARSLAAVTRAAGAPSEVAAAAGWVGVDMVLGAGDDCCADRVLEVNPRMTTSFVGLAAIEERSLLSCMLDAASGTAPVLRPVPGRAVDFDAMGSVRVRDA